MTRNKKKKLTISVFTNAKIKVLSVILLIVIGLLSVSLIFVFNKPSLLQEEVSRDDTEIVDDIISPPEIDQAVSLEIIRIHKKGMDKIIQKAGTLWKKSPIYYFTALLDGAEWRSKVINKWDTGYVGWEAFQFVEDELEECDVIIKIIESTTTFLQPFDVERETVKLIYNFKTGQWRGDDNFDDTDGYGHYNGKYFEIWFDVHQLDGDADGIPYWWEVNILHTDPTIDDSRIDPDNDGIPTTWEWKWGYNPVIFDNHTVLDPEEDGLSNVEEYQMRKWAADPFHKDIYLEVDTMMKGPELFAHDHVFWKESQYLLMDEFSEHDITLHIDDGWPGGPTNGGGEFLEYIDQHIGIFSGLASEFYKYHFSDDRKGIFRYVIIVHSGGWNYAVDYKLWCDVITIPSSHSFYSKVFFPPALTPRLKRIAMAVSVMHELGHSLNLNPHYHEGIDNASQVGRNDLPVFQKLKAKREANIYWETYQSCMNYNKFGQYFLGYSDGSHGIRDADDWSQIDLTYFQRVSEESIGVGSDI